MTTRSIAETADAIRETLISPNESDRNMEQANVVDGLFAIARGLLAIAQSIDGATSELAFIAEALRAKESDEDEEA